MGLGIVIGRLLVYTCVTVSAHYVPHIWHDTVCLSCTGVARLEDCRTVQRCQQQQECYVEKVIPGAHHFNRRVYNLGCVESQPSSWTNHGGFPVCKYSCHGNICNQYGCGLTGYSVGRGPVCYNCQHEDTRDACNAIDICSSTEWCGLRRIGGSGNSSYTTSCEPSNMCHDAAVVDDGLRHPMLGRRQNDVKRTGQAPRKGIETRRRSNDVCMECCADDLCNDRECIISTPPPTTTTTSPTTTKITTTTAAIVAWGAWASWSNCSGTCGRGDQFRVRSCLTGSSCQGDTVQLRACNMPTCYTVPIDGQWGVWGSWQRCSATCGPGTYRHRFRHCDSPAPRHGGRRCPGHIVDAQKCNDAPCCSAPPVITQFSQNISVAAGGMVILNCNATGLDTMLWEGPQVVGRAFPSNVDVLPGGDSLLISRLTAENAGVYSCVVRNRCGAVSKTTAVSIRT